MAIRAHKMYCVAEEEYIFLTKTSVFCLNCRMCFLPFVKISKKTTHNNIINKTYVMSTRKKVCDTKVTKIRLHPVWLFLLSSFFSVFKVYKRVDRIKNILKGFAWCGINILFEDFLFGCSVIASIENVKQIMASDIYFYVFYMVFYVLFIFYPEIFCAQQLFETVQFK